MDIIPDRELVGNKLQEPPKVLSRLGENIWVEFRAYQAEAFGVNETTQLQS